MDKSKIDKMSGNYSKVPLVLRMETDYWIDEQIAQMYELMQSIRKRELEENDPENQER